jgi:membrane protein YdbS with pleckstrin-like domain
MLPLQFAVPGGSELFVILLVLVVPVALGYYVYQDARKRDEDQSMSALWAVVVGGLVLIYVIPGIVAFAAYRYTHSGPPASA